MVTKSAKPNKGSFVSDANANRNYVAIAIEEGWKEIHLPHTTSHKTLSDLAIVNRYTKGIHPIFTADKTAYTLTSKDLRKSGYIVHQIPAKEEEQAYREQIRTFFRTHSEKVTHNTIWIISLIGKPTSQKITGLFL